MSQYDAIKGYAEEKLEALRRKDLSRNLVPTARRKNGRIMRDDKPLICFCDNDYLGLSQDPRIIDAAARALEKFGAGSGASRLIVGDCPLNSVVEEKVAKIKGMEAARLFGSGYLANIGVIPALVGACDLILIDELAHSCLHMGARLSGANILTFRHNDVDHARSLLGDKIHGQKILLLTETIFSMDGDAAPLEELSALCDQSDAWLMTDDAHGFGVVDLENPAPIQMGTFSKAVGAYGGYVCGPSALIDLLTSRARSFVYTTGLPPAVLGAISRSLDIIAVEPSLGRKAIRNAQLFADLIGHNAPIESAILPVIIGDSKKTVLLSKALQEEGFLVSAIRPPTVPDGTARLRFTFSSAHEETDIRALASAYKKVITENL